MGMIESSDDVFKFEGSWLCWPVWLVPILYLATIGAIQKHVKANGSYNLKTVVIVHNLCLSVVSGLLLAAMVWELGRMFLAGGFWSVFCDPDGRWTSGRIYELLYINYILKYVELGDTVLLALRGRPVTFLHSYHHAATLVLCYTQLVGQTCLQWLVVTINLGVHVLMYGFYALHALGYDVWWKRYLTILQIAQFVVVVAVGGVTFAVMLITKHVYTFAPEYLCHGDEIASHFGMFILTSYLVLFIQFYRKTYKKSE